MVSALLRSRAVARSDDRGGRQLRALAGTDSGAGPSARAEWDANEQDLFPCHHLEFVRIVSVANEGLQRWVGATFADLVAERGGHPSDVLADWVLENKGTPGLAVSGMGNADAARNAQFLADRATTVR